MPSADTRPGLPDVLAEWPDAVVVVRDGRFADANRAALKLLGVATLTDLAATDPRTCFSAESWARIDHLFAPGRSQPASDPRLAEVSPPASSAAASPVSLAAAPTSPASAPVLPGQRVDVTVRRPDGTPREVELTLAWHPPDDASVGVTLRDVTAERESWRFLQEREERLRLAFAGAEEGVWDWNLETGAVVYSARWKAMLGYADDEVEPSVRAWEGLIHPDDRDAALAAAQRVARGEPAYRVECRLRHKAGHYIHVLSRGFPVRNPNNGRVRRIVGTHLDLTEQHRAARALRESEERLTLAFAGAQEGVWDWNLETGAVVYSRRWKEMLGYADDEIEPHVSAWERLLHPDDRATADAVHRSVQEGHPSYEAEFRVRHRDGHFVHVLSRGLPIRRADGTVVRIVGTHFDLTERKRTEEALRRAHAEHARTEMLGRLVFAQEDERRRIAREMHDQFGEHLTAFARCVERLAALGDVDPRVSTEVRTLDHVAQRLDRDVDHLVWQLRPTALDDLGLRAALANYVKDWSARVAIPIQMHTAGLLDERLPADVETTLYRIAQEALTNVAKHSRATQVDVILERRADVVVLAVEDNGVGFEADADVADRATTDRSFGLLGMRERAALIGATLSIESTLGQGTTVLLRKADSAHAGHD